jgi:ribosomal protein L37E
MTDGTDRVCPRCGTLAGENDYCSKCGFHLAQEPELPTKEQWEARQTEASQAPQTDAGSTVSASGGAEAGSRNGGDGEPPGHGLQERWGALGTTAKRFILAGAGVVVVVVVVLIATSGGGGSPATSSNTGNTGANTGNSGSTVSDAQICAERWNSEASELEKQQAGQFATEGGTSTGRAAAGYEASNPGSCLITVGNGSSTTTGAFMQFNESSGVFTQGATGVDQQLPGDWVWNASIDSTGAIALGGSGNTGSGGSNTGNSGTSGNSG